MVGGGPAGIQAMLTLCDRGHDVTLYEKSDRLGGNLVPGSALPFKQDVRDYLDYSGPPGEQGLGGRAP